MKKETLIVTITILVTLIIAGIIILVFLPDKEEKTKVKTKNHIYSYEEVKQIAEKLYAEENTTIEVTEENDKYKIVRIDNETKETKNVFYFDKKTGEIEEEIIHQEKASVITGG